MRDDSFWMSRALDEAERAFRGGEVPVGAVVVHENSVVGSGYNTVEGTGCPLDHAEIRALRRAFETLGRWELSECVVFVTVEPCAMCVGAMLLARVAKVVFGAREPRTGACESVLSIPNEPALGRRLAVVGGVEEDRCRALLRDFFKRKRRHIT